MQDSKTFSADLPHLDNSDFSSNGDLIRNKGKVGVVMMQGNFCGFCTTNKGFFQQFFDNHKDQYFIATLEVDSDRAAQLMSRIKKVVKNYSGVPFYLLYSPSGRLLMAHTAPRSYEELVKYAESAQKVK